MCFGRFDTLLRHFFNNGGQIYKENFAQNGISEYFYFQVVVNQEHIERCCLKKQSLSVTLNALGGPQPCAKLSTLGDMRRGVVAPWLRPAHNSEATF